jgi:hypothetical protein
VTLLRLPGQQEGDVGTARFETFLRRLLGVKGVVAPRVEPKLSGGFDLLRPPWELAEVALLQGWRGYQGFANVAGVALQLGYAQLQNPAGSNVLIVCDLVELIPDGGQPVGYLELIPGTLFAGAAQAVTRRDSRGTDPVTLAGAGVLMGGTGVGAPGYSSRYVKASTDVMVGVPCRYVITPGYALQLLNPVVAVAVAANFQWWERAGEPSELAAR